MITFAKFANNCRLFTVNSCKKPTRRNIAQTLASALRLTGIIQFSVNIGKAGLATNFTHPLSRPGETRPGAITETISD
ncbi:hypothetical protein [Microbulbifer sp. ALW1]|uniref:hypothetical protein n=1 Tax=Microbulbifer sp. (strain ALW1) TaxID=1516059 RepID=UPI0013576A52|nr:hypothetical protein [Microbulbifer sp. ALW1]